MTADEERLLSRFSFRPELTGHLGVEREFFLTGHDGMMPVPESPRFLARTSDPAAWTYELSACQVEHRTPPCPDLESLIAAIMAGQEQGERCAAEIDRRLTTCEVGPEDMPLDYYPDDPRYAAIAAELPRHILSAACRVTGTHVHYGVRSFEHGIRVLNELAKHLKTFIALGDSSQGERIRLYREMATRWEPVHIESTEHFASVMIAEAHAQNATDITDPRNCWHFIRFSRHGTVEVRAFGTTTDLVRILGWAAYIKKVADAVS